MGSSIEIWGGIECTVNRIGEQFFDQIESSGHATRKEDLELLSRLGITKLRYPVLWERVAPKGLKKADWAWTDERLATLQRLGIEPIVGLLHHGSGPRYTHLLDEEFPEKFAEFAGAVAKRYPWVRYFTPINEPLTTARFSALYGLWYPHYKDTASFLRALLIQCRGICKAMRAIREVSPQALLVQTEDLGKTHSTPELQYQARFENARRWFSIDLLTGTFERNSQMMSHCFEYGVDKATLRKFFPERCVPDILGLNYYITSERYIDHRLWNYQPNTHGGNRRERYADVAAVRVCIEGPQGLAALAQEAWERFHLPLAVTESHLNCTREEQVRWLYDTYAQTKAAAERGVDFRAFTAWSLFGAYDWVSLLTRQDGAYESGAFDLRSPTPRKTAVARAIEALGSDNDQQHPVLDTGGWWQRQVRLEYAPVFRENRVTLRGLAHPKQTVPPRRLVVTSDTSIVGEALTRLCRLRGLEAVLLSPQDPALGSERQVRQVLDEVRPWAVINSIDFEDVDGAQCAQVPARRLLCEIPVLLATLCEQRGIPLMTFSSAYVFDGVKATPYVESDQTNPLNFYGFAKAKADARISRVWQGALICRFGLLFGQPGQGGAVDDILTRLSMRQSVDVPSDLTCSPAFVDDVVQAALDLLIDEERGMWHLSSGLSINWAHFLALLAQQRGFAISSMRPWPLADMDYTAVRPHNLALGSERGNMLPPLEDAVKRSTRQSAVLR